MSRISQPLTFSHDVRQCSNSCLLSGTSQAQGSMFGERWCNSCCCISQRQVLQGMCESERQQRQQSLTRFVNQKRGSKFSSAICLCSFASFPYLMNCFSSVSLHSSCAKGAGKREENDATCICFTLSHLPLSFSFLIRRECVCVCVRE